MVREASRPVREGKSYKGSVYLHMAAVGGGGKVPKGRPVLRGRVLDGDNEFGCEFVNPVELSGRVILFRRPRAS
jgi:hypothetical protein